MPPAVLFFYTDYFSLQSLVYFRYSLRCSPSLAERNIFVSMIFWKKRTKKIGKIYAVRSSLFDDRSVRSSSSPQGVSRCVCIPRLDTRSPGRAIARIEVSLLDDRIVYATRRGRPSQHTPSTACRRFSALLPACRSRQSRELEAFFHAGRGYPHEQAPR